MPRSASRRRLLPLAVFLLLFLALAAWIGLRALAAQRHLEDARDELAVAREALLDRDIAAAQAAIVTAGEDTDRARALTSDPVWRLAAAVPVAGRSLETAGGLAQAADDLARGVLPLALQAAKDVDPETLRRPDGSIDLGVLEAATPPISASADRAEAVMAEVAELPTDGTVTAIADAQAELAEQVSELADVLRGSAQALKIAPALLGEDRLRRYLMLVQQTAESRGTGGLIGGYVLLEAEDGRIRVVDEGSNAELPTEKIPPPPDVPQDFVDLYAEDGGFELWVNANLSPDLPNVAKVIESRWQAQRGQALDGVVMVDGIALSQMLRGSGDIDLGDGTSVSPEGLVDYLAVEQYRGIPFYLSPDGRAQTRDRKDRLDRVTAAVASRLAGGGGDTLQLLRGVSEAVRSGHLQMASDEPALQPTLQATGLDGGLPRGSAPVAFAMVYNSTGGKLDHFLDRKIDYTAGPCEGDTRFSTIVVELTNRAPAEGLPAYSTVRHTTAGIDSSTMNAVTLQIYGTPGAELFSATVDGEISSPQNEGGALVNTASEAGLPMWNLFLHLPPNETRRVVLELDEPVVAGEPRVPEQPLSRPLQKEVDVPVCGP